MASGQILQQAEVVRQRNENEFLMTITCPICLNYFHDPVQMPTCPHTLCRKCLQRLDPALKLDNPATVECPICRKESRIDKTSELPVNRVAKQIVEMVEAQEEIGDISVMSEEDPEVHFAYRCSHFLVPQADKERCGHCNQLFCRPCRVSHIGMLMEKASKLKNKLKSHEIGPESQTSCDLNNLYSEIANQLNDQVAEIRNECQAEADLIIANVKKAVDSKVQSLLTEAESIRSEQLNSLNRIISTCLNAGVIGNQIEEVTKKLPFRSSLNETSEALRAARQAVQDIETLDEVVKNRKCHEMKFVPDRFDGTDELIGDFVREIDLGWVHVYGQTTLLRQQEIDGDSNQATKRAEMSIFTDEGGDVEEDTIMDSIKLEDCNITEPIGLVALPQSDFFVIADRKSYLSVFRALPGFKLAHICTLCLSDNSIEGEHFARVYLTGEVVADSKRIYFIDSHRLKIRCFDIPWQLFLSVRLLTRKTFLNTQVFTESEQQFSSLSIDLDRHRLFSMEGDKFRCFSTAFGENPQGAEENFVKFGSSANLLAYHSSIGLLISRDDGRVFKKSEDENGRLLASEDDDVSLATANGNISMEDFSLMASGHVDVDSDGIVYCANLEEESLLALWNEKTTGENWTWTTSDGRLRSSGKTVSIAPCALAVLRKRPSSELPQNVNSILGKTELLAFIDNNTDSVVLMKIKFL